MTLWWMRWALRNTDRRADAVPTNIHWTVKG